ncbi:MAG: hypothetical protein JW703_02175 [Candidatus Diapherotrites archaeon]|nr:hypothetical protein [Candidatus Diapherotrites archaeon]
MNKIILEIGLLILLLGCVGPTEPTYFKNTSSLMTPECKEFKNDVCGAFECMVQECWCMESPDRILFENYIEVKTEQEALNLVNVYLYSEHMEKGAELITAKNAFKLNSVFYNVFAEDFQGNELVFTVAADGTIIKTQCGV